MSTTRCLANFVAVFAGTHMVLLGVLEKMGYYQIECHPHGPSASFVRDYTPFKRRDFSNAASHPCF
ncbi:hypothetical protein BTJ68_14801 [Hortaea werneckii EXF-2000]|uniref:Uncharacterized protein n=1 Tax=Hortaea werneckii EXF-2000 TaxID=1157616 RepID=A0A1Z5SNQ7_HORWE|nr:hypothetical protein BTJ68_14801 [Hortaea werneckii EXF-2000]